MLQQAVAVADTTLRAQVFARVDAIGAKLGVAANHLWPVLVRQAWVEGVGDIVVALVLVAVFVALARAAKYCFRGDYDLEMPGVFAIMGCIICLIVFTVVTVDAVQHVLNPEYYAFHDLVQAVWGGK